MCAKAEARAHARERTCCSSSGVAYLREPRACIGTVSVEAHKNIKENHPCGAQCRRLSAQASEMMVGIRFADNLEVCSSLLRGWI